MPHIFQNKYSIGYRKVRKKCHFKYVTGACYNLEKYKYMCF